MGSAETTRHNAVVAKGQAAVARLCSVCTHPRRADIDEALLRHTQSYRGIARRYGLQDDALRRHEHTHLRMSLQQSRELTAMLSGKNLLDRLSELDAKTGAIFARALARNDLRAAIGAIREAREVTLAYARVGMLIDAQYRIDRLEQERLQQKRLADGAMFNDLFDVPDLAARRGHAERAVTPTTPQQKYEDHGQESCKVADTDEITADTADYDG